MSTDNYCATLDARQSVVHPCPVGPGAVIAYAPVADVPVVAWPCLVVETRTWDIQLTVGHLASLQDPIDVIIPNLILQLSPQQAQALAYTLLAHGRAYDDQSVVVPFDYEARPNDPLTIPLTESPAIRVK